MGRFCDNIVVLVWRKCLRNGFTFLFVPDITMEKCSLCANYGKKKTWKNELKISILQKVSDTVRSFGKIF